MRSAIKILEDIKMVLDVPELLQHVDGGVWLFDYPDNSEHIYICLGILPVRNRYFVSAPVNLRIYAPMLSVTINNKIQQQPDHLKFGVIEKIIEVLLNDYYGGDFSTRFLDGGRLQRNTDGSFFFHISIEYSYLNFDSTTP